MNSTKTVLSEKILIEQELPKACIVNNTDISRKIKQDYLNSRFDISNISENISLEYDIQYTRIQDYIKESLFAYHGIQVFPIRHFANLQRHEEPSIITKHENVVEPRNSADYVALYMVNGEANLFLNYDNNVRKEQGYYTELKEGSIAIFNSTIKYHLSRNKSEHDRTVLTFLYKLT